jgi:hypothetical protein
MYTHDEMQAEVRRVAPRIEVEAFCNEIVAHRERHGVVLDLSMTGVNLVRPFTGGGPRERAVQLELELPGVDEIIWARGEICHQQIQRAGRRMDGLGKVVLQSGIRLVSAAARDLRTLREYILWKRRAAESDAAISAGLASPWFALR